jgi:hypothetical protein
MALDTTRPAVATGVAPQRPEDAYRAAYNGYGDVIRHLEDLVSLAFKPLALAELYAEDHPESEAALETVAAAHEIVDFLRFLVERMHSFRRFMALQAFTEAWPEHETAITAANERETGMSNLCPSTVTRFEPLRLSQGWTVMDLLCETAIETRQRWGKSEAATVAEALSAAPAYAIHWTWQELTHYPLPRWDVLARPISAVSPDGRSMIRLLPGTNFAYSKAEECGRAEIAAFAPGSDVDSLDLWLVDEAELWEAAARMPSQEVTA